MTYYYIAKRKPRGRSPRYVGDGIIDSDSVKEAKRAVADMYGSPISCVEVRPYKSS